MGSLTPLWRHLEDYPGVPLTMEGWRGVCGPGFPFLEHRLRRTGELAASYPSPRPNSPDLTVFEHPSGRLVAVCDEDPMLRVELDADALALHELDPTRLGEEVAKALGLQPATTAPVGPPGVRLLGEWRPRASIRVPAWQVSHRDAATREVLVRGLATASSAPALIFTNTDSWWAPEFAACLLQLKAVIIPLAEVVEAGGNEGLNAASGWGAYTDAARRLVGLRPASDFGDPPRYHIGRDGEFWHVVFDGRKSPPLKSGGFAYLQLLVRFPGQSFTFEELCLVDHPADVTLDSGTPGADIDKKAAGEYYRRMRDLLDEEDEAKANNDHGATEAARRKRLELSKEIDRAMFQGRFRTQPKEMKNLRLRITAKITRAVSELKKHDLAAWQHLKPSIFTAGGPVYRPKQPISWQI